VKSRSTLVALLLVQLFFATLPIAVKVALRDLSPPALALLRVAGAAALFWALHRATVGERVRGWGDYGRLALYSLFGVIANQLLYITALTLTTATAVQTLVVTGPALTLLVAILLRQERATAARWTGIAVAGGGALLLVGVGLHEGSALGNLLALLNVTAYSIYMVISRGLLTRYQALTVITWVLPLGAGAGRGEPGGNLRLPPADPHRRHGRPPPGRAPLGAHDPRRGPHLPRRRHRPPRRPQAPRGTGGRCSTPLLRPAPRSIAVVGSRAAPSPSSARARTRSATRSWRTWCATGSPAPSTR
jgi:uncharacterized membrane protein